MDFSGWRERELLPCIRPHEVTRARVGLSGPSHDARKVFGAHIVSSPILPLAQNYGDYDAHGRG